MNIIIPSQNSAKYARNVKNRAIISEKMGNKILLIDVDSKYPNIALMKISTYHKNQGDYVDLIRLGFDGYPKKCKQKIIDASDYHKVYASVIFTNNKDNFKVINNDNIEIGGSGYDLKKKLPQEIDDCIEDYSIYPDNNISYGFMTRGCINKCYFCFVPEKEGMIHFYRHPRDIIKHDHTEFFDNNILAYDKHEELLQWLIDNKIDCRFNQGIDIRIMTENDAILLADLKCKDYIFAFDNINDKHKIEEKLRIFKKYFKLDWKIKFYIYISPSMDIQNNIINRIEWCRQNKVLPYIMRDQSCWDDNRKIFWSNLSAWCNQPGIFKNMKFEDFINKRTITDKNKQFCINLFYNIPE